MMKTVDDFRKLHEAVSVYKQSHDGDYFVMANDIDFSSAEDFRGVLLSTGKCKISDLTEENIFRRVKIQFFARSSVDFLLDFANESIR